MRLFSERKIRSWVLQSMRRSRHILPQAWVLHSALTRWNDRDTYHLDECTLINWSCYRCWMRRCDVARAKVKRKKSLSFAPPTKHQNGRSQCKQAVLFTDLYWNYIFPTGPQSLQYLADFESAECKSFPLLSSFSNNLWPILFLHL